MLLLRLCIHTQRMQDRITREHVTKLQREAKASMSA